MSNRVFEMVKSGKKKGMMIIPLDPCRTFVCGVGVGGVVVCYEVGLAGLLAVEVRRFLAKWGGTGWDGILSVCKVLGTGRRAGAEKCPVAWENRLNIGLNSFICGQRNRK